MYKILENKLIGEKTYELDVLAPLVVGRCLPGQFVIVMAYEKSERIPLTIYDYDRSSGVLKMIYQVVGASTLELTELEDQIFSVVGPLGKPSRLIVDDKEWMSKRILFVAGGVGIAPIYPQAKYLYALGAQVDVIYGAKSANFLIIEDEIKSVCDNLYIATDDGSKGYHGMVTDCLKDLNKQYDVCVAIGPVVMMKFVAQLTKKIGIPTVVSMNPIMVDGTGMCGACRVLVDGEVKFACVDGPEFDGEKMDFDAAIKRMNLYKSFEGRKYLEKQEGDTHHGHCGNCGDK